jgi:adenylosuccinate lyase
MARYPVRGLKGAVGTQLDQLTLLGGAANKVAEPREPACSSTSASDASLRVGQVYPRSLDFEVVSALHQIAAPAASFAVTLRLMAGAGLVTEGFQEGQVGSSAMPHKVNARNCERICGFSTILSGYVTMTGGAGRPSVERRRRVLLRRPPGGAAGRVLRHRRLLETFLTVLRQMEVFPRRSGGERAQPALPRHDHDPDGGGEKRRRPRDRARGDQGARLAAAKAMRSGNGGADLLAGSPATAGSASARKRFRPSWPRARASSGRRPTRSTPSRPRSSRWPSASRAPPNTARGACSSR